MGPYFWKLYIQPAENEQNPPSFPHEFRGGKRQIFGIGECDVTDAWLQWRENTTPKNGGVDNLAPPDSSESWNNWLHLGVFYHFIHGKTNMKDHHIFFHLFFLIRQGSEGDPNFGVSLSKCDEEGDSPVSSPWAR